ncbi:MAG: LolA family protein [Nitrospinota bacterium]
MNLKPPLLLLVIILIATAQSLKAGELATELANNALGSIKTLSASFEQIKANRSFKNKDISRGKIIIIRPDRFRLDFENGKSIVADGENLIAYDPQTKKVYKGNLRTTASKDILFMLLLGKVKLSKIFTISRIKNSDQSKYYLKLLPKKGYPALKGLLIILRKGSLDILTIKIIDQLGNSNSFNFFDHTSIIKGRKNMFKIKKIDDLKIEPFDLLYKKGW